MTEPPERSLAEAEGRQDTVGEEREVGGRGWGCVCVVWECGVL